MWGDQLEAVGAVQVGDDGLDLVASGDKREGDEF